MKQKKAKGYTECFGHFCKRINERFPELAPCTKELYEEVRQSVPKRLAKLVEKESNSRKHYLLDIKGITIRFIYNTNINLPVTVVREDDLNDKAEEAKLFSMYESESLSSEDI
jgi:hypothetical protein